MNIDAELLRVSIVSNSKQVTLFYHNANIINVECGANAEQINLCEEYDARIDIRNVRP